MPTTKRIEIITHVQVCLISWMEINYKENGGKKKAFLANPKHQDYASHYGECDCSVNNKKNADYYKYQVCPISRMDINCKENGGKKSFSYKSEASGSCILIWRT